MVIIMILNDLIVKMRAAKFARGNTSNKCEIICLLLLK